MYMYAYFFNRDAEKLGNVPVSTSRSVMDKVEEFNREINRQLEDERIHVIGRTREGNKEIVEITLEDLEEELEEAEEDLENVGDSPMEVGRQIHEAIERAEFYNDGDVSQQQTLRRNCSSVFLADQTTSIKKGICLQCRRKRCSVIDMNNSANVGECVNFMSIYVSVNCYVCGRKLHHPESIPIGIPDKWKLCCYCHDVWLYNKGLLTGESSMVYLTTLELDSLTKVYKEKLEEAFKL